MRPFSLFIHVLSTVRQLVCLLILPLGLSVLLTAQTLESVAEYPQAKNDQMIEVGDLLELTLKEDPLYTFSGKVSEDGSVDLPLLGERSVAGQTTQSTQLELSAELEKEHYWKATLAIRIVARAPAAIYVYGAVKEPGMVELPSSGQISIPRILSSVKGLTAWADIDSAYLVRTSAAGEEEKIPLNVRELLLSPASQGGLTFMKRDELFIPGLNGSVEGISLTSEPMEVIVVGQVGTPGVIKFAPGEAATLMRAVFKAGGLTRFAKGGAIKLIRYSDRQRTVEEVDLEVVIEEGFLEKDRLLLPGDMVIVPQKFINL